MTTQEGRLVRDLPGDELPCQVEPTTLGFDMLPVPWPAVRAVCTRGPARDAATAAGPGNDDVPPQQLADETARNVDVAVGYKGLNLLNRDRSDPLTVVGDLHSSLADGRS